MVLCADLKDGLCVELRLGKVGDREQIAAVAGERSAQDLATQNRAALGVVLQALQMALQVGVRVRVAVREVARVVRQRERDGERERVVRPLLRAREEVRVVANVRAGAAPADALALRT